MALFCFLQSLKEVLPGDITAPHEDLQELLVDLVIGRPDADPLVVGLAYRST